MSTTGIGNQNCENVLGLLDAYLDNELSKEDASQVTDHLRQCEVCSRELDTRRTIRERLRSAIRNIPVSPNLHIAIRESIQSTRGSSRSFVYRKALPIAAALLICLSAAVAYRLGYLRLTKRSQEAYLASISAPVADIMRVGLGDHVHCAVYRAFSKQHPTFEEMAHDLGQYKDLVPIVAKLIPQDYRIETAHQCRYHTRRFVHLTMRKGSALVSVVLSRRGNGESFERDQLVPALTESGIGIYQSSAQRFEISGFETPDYVVYVVSNLSREDNRDMMLALAPSVASFLRSIPG